MTGRVIAAAKSAYQYPLIIKHLWHAPLLQAADQEIVYRELRRHAGHLREADIKAHLEAFAIRGFISKYGIPEKIQFVDHLARTSVGKIDKKGLRETYGQFAVQR